MKILKFKEPLYILGKCCTINLKCSKLFLKSTAYSLGNALEWVQWVHAPKNLQDITFRTRRILTDFITVLVF